jgi:hypothetical protein
MKSRRIRWARFVWKFNIVVKLIGKPNLYDQEGKASVAL